MIFLGNFIGMNSEPPIVLFPFHTSQLVVTVDFGVGFYDVSRVNLSDFMCHLDKSIADFF